MLRPLLVTLLLALVLFLVLPTTWYVITIAGFVGGLLAKKAWQGFTGTLLGGLLLVLGWALLIDVANDGLMSGRMAGNFGIPGGLMAPLSALVLGLAAGLGGWAGAYARKLFMGRKN